jgi:hypothetical protein
MHTSFNKFLSLTTLSVCLVSLSGCDSFRNTFGLDHYQPDEFKVSDNPPLSIPKDYRLRPPANGQSNNEAGTTVSKAGSSQEQAQNLLLGTPTATTGTSKGASEQALLSMASSQQQATPNIRDTVDKEAAVATNVSDSLIQRIMGWREEAAKNIASINGEQQTPQANTIVNEQKVN